MSQWQGKSKSNTLGYKIFVFLLKNLGLGAAYFLLFFVAFYYFIFSTSSSKHIYYFYNKILKFGKMRSLVMLYTNYFKLGQTLIDKTAMIAKIKTNFTYTFEGRNYLEELAKKGKGGLLLSAHVGNWEAAGQMLEHLNTKINIVMYDGEDENIKKYMDGVTGKRTFKIIYVKEDLSHIFEIKKALASNELVCIHADRFLPENKIITGEFFNKPVKFPYGPFLLSLKMNAPTVFVFAFKESKNHYHFFSSSPVEYSKSKGDTEQIILEAFIKDLESKVARYPTQWFNYHDFFQG
ncbi:MAG: lysophospholipid acyltransferase family protein [Bacteroidetes bacterium]|nr:lysophospholipid acyltransferase family protein [Bacteroidota bacterium]